MKRLMTIRRRNSLTGYMFMFPWLIGLFLFTLYPIFLSLRISFSNVSVRIGGFDLIFAGFEHYIVLLTQDVQFNEFLLNDIRFMSLSLFIVLPFSLIVAVMLNAKFKARALFRMVFFLPVIIMSGPAIGRMMGDMGGLFINQRFIMFLLMIMPDMMTDAVSFVLSNLVTFMWFSGVQILIFLAGLQKIDGSIYEAAEIDGASKWESFWKITLPYMKMLILINALYTIIEIANFGGSASPHEGNWNVQIDQQVGQINFIILQNVHNAARPFSFSAAMSWIYALSILLILLVVYGIYRFFEGREQSDENR